MLPGSGAQSRRYPLAATVSHLLVPLEHVCVPVTEHLQPFLLPATDNFHGYSFLTGGGGGSWKCIDMGERVEWKEGKKLLDACKKGNKLGGGRKERDG